jgi:hypothetical protein
MSKTTTKKKNPVNQSKPRSLAVPRYRSFRLQKRLPRAPMPTIAGSFILLGRSLGLLKRHWKLFLGIVAVYALLNLLLVQNFFGIDISATKATAEQTLTGTWGKVTGGFSVLTYMFGASGNSPSTNAYRLILGFIGSLAMIYALRQIIAGKNVRIRDGFYLGMYPLIPFVLVFLVISLELIPIALATYLFTAVGNSNGAETVLWIIVLTSLTAVTLYLLSSSILALYIVCLPGVAPLTALRSAVRLVRGRRAVAIRRLLFLPLVLAILLSVVMIPIIWLATPLASVVFFIFLMIVLPLVHAYLYNLYRELLHE